MCCVQKKKKRNTVLNWFLFQNQWKVVNHSSFFYFMRKISINHSNHSNEEVKFNTQTKQKPKWNVWKCTATIHKMFNVQCFIVFDMHSDYFLNFDGFFMSLVICLIFLSLFEFKREKKNCIKCCVTFYILPKVMIVSTSSPTVSSEQRNSETEMHLMRKFHCPAVNRLEMRINCNSNICNFYSYFTCWQEFFFPSFKFLSFIYVHQNFFNLKRKRNLMTSRLSEFTTWLATIGCDLV